MEENTASAGFFARLRKLDWKKIAVIAALLVIVAAVAVALLSLGSNNKTSPVRVMQKYANARDVDLGDLYRDVLAGMENNRAARLLDILDESDEFELWIERREGAFDDACAGMQNLFGRDFRIRYRNDKSLEEKLEREELKEYRSRIKTLGESYAELGKALGKLKNADLRDLAEDLDLDIKELRAAIQCLKDIGKKLRAADVSDGYELVVLVKITGSELDGPEEDDFDLTVLKVNGRWISADSLNELDALLDLLTEATRAYR